jgi:hypothetical protein
MKKKLSVGCVAVNQKTGKRAKVLVLNKAGDTIIVFGKPCEVWAADDCLNGGIIGGGISEAELKLAEQVKPADFNKPAAAPAPEPEPVPAPEPEPAPAPAKKAEVKPAAEAANLKVDKNSKVSNTKKVK